MKGFIRGGVKETLGIGRPELGWIEEIRSEYDCPVKAGWGSGYMSGTLIINFYYPDEDGEKGDVIEYCMYYDEEEGVWMSEDVCSYNDWDFEEVLVDDRDFEN